MRGGGDGHDGGSPSGGGSEGNAGGGKGGKGGGGQNGGNDTSNNSGIGGGLGHGGEGGGNENSGGSENGRGPGSDTGAGRRGAASAAFGGGLSSDESNIGNVGKAGTPGSANNTNAGQSTAEGKSEAPGQDRSAFGTVSNAISKGYNTVADTFSGLVDSAVSTVAGPTQSDLSKFGTGWTGAGNTSRANAGTRAAMSGAQAAVDQTKSKTAADFGSLAPMGMLGKLGVNTVNAVQNSRMSPGEERAFNDVMSQRGSPVSGLGGTLQSVIGGMGGLAANTGVNLADVQTRTNYAEQNYGLKSAPATRRSNAVSAFASTNSSNNIGSPLSSNQSNNRYNFWQPSSMKVGDYGRHNKGLLY